MKTDYPRLTGFPEVITAEEAIAREAGLNALGFKAHQIDRLRQEKPVLVDPIKVNELALELESAGLEEALNIFQRQPRLLLRDIDVLSDNYSFLCNLGFQKVNKVIRKFPNILGTSPDAIINHLEELARLGFGSPIHLVESSPSIIGLSIENIEDKLRELMALGFDSPTTLVERMPSTLTTAVATLARRVKLVKRLGRVFEWDEDPSTVVEQVPAILTTKQEKILILARLATVSTTDKSEVDYKLLNQFIKSGIDELLIAAGELDEYTLRELIRRAARIKKHGGTEDAKDHILNSSNLPRNIIRLYIQGYL